ncbi:MAG: SMC-Scp complex subunit ScpB [Planctomycetes bacterium]|nr:SMC-Scp complex subunit ScpB [Planctomycetota bacterium]MCB9868593.1 SMC-Scp complex subunit ScpB [Planctomycetota bacterium]
MDDISRGSLPEDSGQGVVEPGLRHKDPMVDPARAGGVEFADRFGIEPAHRFGTTEADALIAEDPDASDPDDASAAIPPEDHPAEPDEVGGDEAEPRASADDSHSSPDASDGDAPPPVSDEALPRVLCALLLSSREPLSLLRLAEVTRVTQKQVRAALDALHQRLESSTIPIEVSIAGDQVRLLTAPDVFPFLCSLRSVKKQDKLSAAALETLAVIAYRQPVIRAEIEAIRGVKAGPILRTLLDHRMIRTVGRADVPGRPLQYGTTQHFLETFGLTGLEDLPSVREFRAL